ncbi:Yst0336-like domain protein [Pseudohyphozyma bogoriensis]|nr:Yst0336-like domain protein [Pseudohyphozyma bogoriensis]
MGKVTEIGDLDGLGGASGPVPKDFDAENAPNHEEIEMQFAVVCFEHAETYFNLITKIKPSTLPRLTKHDDLLMEAFAAAFPELQSDERLSKINEDEMKSPENKKRWRAFMMPFENLVDDYNFGTLIRADCEGEYDEKNSIFGLRTQFYAIEIARNRRKLNDKIWEKYQKA